MAVCVYFGNVSIDELEKIMGVSFSEDDKKWLNEKRSESVKYGDDHFHIFSLPHLQLHCGKNIENELIKRLSKYDYSNATQRLSVVGEIGEQE